MKEAVKLAVDLGGTKLLLALVDKNKVVDRVEAPTDRDAGPEAWLSQIAELADRWKGRFDSAGITVTGLVHDGRWSALNPSTLTIPGQFPLMVAAQSALAVPVVLCNDAQAAAWGEHRFGAGQGKDLVFLTISTGVGGGVVMNGHLLQGRGGLAGHFGQALPQPDGPSNERFEDGASGSWIAAKGKELGLPSDARAIFAAASASNDAAEHILSTSAQRVARLCHNIQLMLAPELIVIGGGVGMAPGYLERLENCVADFSQLVRPTLVRAALGKDAGVIGVADLSKRNQPNREEEK